MKAQGRAAPRFDPNQLFKILFISLVLVGNGCATPYQPLSRSGGYTDRRVGPGTYEVAFQGNSATANQTVQDFVLLRCAEVTLGQGAQSFEIVRALPSNAGYASVVIRVFSGDIPGHTDAARVKASITAKYAHRFPWSGFQSSSRTVGPENQQNSLPGVVRESPS